MDGEYGIGKDKTVQIFDALSGLDNIQVVAIAGKNEKLKDAFDKMFEAYKKYDEIFILCYCKLNESCHGDYIIKKLQNRLVKEKIDEVLKKKAT